MKNWEIGALVLVSYLLCSATMFAQSIPLIMRGEYELTKTAANAPIGASEKRCGDYFVFTSAHVTEEGRVPGISYMYKMIVGGKDAIGIGIFAQKKFRTTIDNKKRVPTVEFVFAGGTVDTITVKISGADYEKAKSCLPPPRK